MIRTNKAQVIFSNLLTSYTGTYTISELEEIIHYANERSVTVIPEIDMPGHARALVKAFPDEMQDPNDISEYISTQGYSDDVLPICNYLTGTGIGIKFTNLINDIVTSTASIFSNQNTLYAVNQEISVGGDEVAPQAWTNDSSCTGSWGNLDALAKSHKFFKMLGEQNQSLKISGWQQYIQNDDERLGNEIVPSTQAGHVWVWHVGDNTGLNQAKTLANAGYPVVLAYADRTYFDLAYTPDIKEPGFSWAGSYLDTYAALSSATIASQTEDLVASGNKANIKGLEGTLWAENLANYNHLMYMALPKMAGLAEAAWADPSKTSTDNNSKTNWHSLAERLGCGTSGFLAYLNQIFAVKYRGYPNGISLEAPSACQR